MSDSTPANLSIQDGIVVTLDYVLRVDGEIVDQSSDNGAIEFLQGYGQIIPGLERSLYGMVVGESKQVTVSAADGYGEIDEEDYAEVPRSEFPDEIPLEAGVELQMRDQDGDIFDATIAEVREDTVLLNFNHPLAGKALEFSVTVLKLREASQEELDHGHSHSGHEHNDEDED